MRTITTLALFLTASLAVAEQDVIDLPVDVNVANKPFPVF
jgi:hypothetical protein